MKQILMTILLLLLCSPVMAGQSCFASSEVEAERVLRLHSELMVIALTCQRTSAGADLVKAYTQFTTNNVNMIKSAEQTLTRYYESVHKGAGTEQLDRLRTRLANEFGQQVAKETPRAYCAIRQDRAMALYDSPSISLLRVASQLYARIQPNEPVCNGGIKASWVQDSATSKKYLHLKSSAYVIPLDQGD